MLSLTKTLETLAETCIKHFSPNCSPPNRYWRNSWNVKCCACVSQFRKNNSLLGMEKHASFHVLVLTITYLRPCGNMSNQHMSDDLSHLQCCSTAALQPRLFGLYTRRMHVSAFSPIYILGVITRNSFRPEPSFRPKIINIRYIVTQALVPFFVS